MTAQKKNVCIGFLGTTLDDGFKPSRWNRWRPSVALLQHQGIRFDRVMLIHDASHHQLLERVKSDMEEASPQTEVVPCVMNLKDPWDFEEVYRSLHNLARTTTFDLDAEEIFVHITTGTHVAQICLFLLTESRHFPAKLFQQSPPRRQLQEEGPGHYNLIDLDLSRYDQIFERFVQEQREGISFLKGGVETKNARFNALIEMIERVAIGSKAPILLHGPTGAGKTQLARRIYDLKQQRRQVEGRFVEVNCATLRGDGAMSALFGHVKGAYTGAIAPRDGLLRTADHGILFLDEIGELGLDEQTMLLRAIESGRFMPVGADTEVHATFQLLAGTNRDLGAGVRAGTFREDLLARIDMWTFGLPGLIERPEDIEPNLDVELDRHTERTGDRLTMNKEARDAYLAFAIHPSSSWRGNFRDLGASVTRMATMAQGGRINKEVVGQECARLRARWSSLEGADRSREEHQVEAVIRSLTGDAFEEIDLFEKAQLFAVVKTCLSSHTLAEAGRVLFSHSRVRKKSQNDSDRLRKYLAKYGLRFEDFHP